MNIYICIYVFSYMLAAFHRPVSINIRLLSFYICTNLHIYMYMNIHKCRESKLEFTDRGQ